MGACMQPCQTVRRKSNWRTLFGDGDEVIRLADRGDACGRITSQHFEFTRHSDLSDDIVHQPAALGKRHGGDVMNSG
jgi:sRNA-binding protein